MRTKITSKQSKELKCSVLLGSPSPVVKAWLAAKSSQPGSAKARALERLAEARIRKARVETLMRLRQPPLRTIFCSDGLVVPGVETSRRIAEAAAKRAADRLEAEERATRKLKVRSLELLPIHTPHRLEGPEWELVLHEMKNLKNLGVSEYVELTDVGRQGITFRLTHFTAFDNLVASWSALLPTQSHIVHLELDLTVSGPAPVLPALKTLIARSGPAAEMLEKNSITELILSQPDTDLRGISDTALDVFSRAQPGLVTLRLGSGELLALMSLPSFCVGIVHLIVDADRTWVWDKQLRTLRSALSKLKKKNMPALRTLRLVAWDRQPSAKNLFKAVRARGPVARLTSVHYCNEWGCHHWSRSKDDVGHELPCDFFEEDGPSWLDGEDSDEEVVLPPDSEFWDLDDTDREASSDSDGDVGPLDTPFRVPLDVVGEIASYTSRPTLLQLFLVSRATQVVVRRYLYRHIVVRNRKHRGLVRTLASDGVLPPLVHTLEFQWTEYCGRVWGPAWDRVLIGMTNLTELTVADHVQLSQAARQGITFTLKYFSTSAAILGNWSLFLQNQPTIELLELEVTLAGTTPVLPNLRRAILAPSIAAKLLEVNTIPELIFYPTFLHSVRRIPQDDISLFTRAQPGLITLRLRCKQFLNLLAAPNIFAQLQHLVLDDDKSWRSDPLISNLRAVSFHLNSDLVPFLSTLRMVSSDTRPSFSKICRAVAERGFLPALHNMHYCCPRGCHNWTRSAEEMAIYVECDHCEGSFLEGHIEETSDWPDNTDSETDTYVDWDYTRWDEIDADVASRIDTIPSPSMNPALARALEPGATRVRRKNPVAGEVETTPYARMGPETPIEKEWRISMQGVADLAEEWVAEGEAKWQADYQLLADWSQWMENKAELRGLGMGEIAQ
ncbi:hypothetical protein C8J57DRAFT_1240584 [Mycena rebaudengoi]|nr:hypothetical protein C8J57DRAFT_1240584 [Mycena rebaudengoi]